jgi:hypothetical protein
LGEGHEIAGLAALEIDDPQVLTTRQPQSGAASCGNELSLGHPSIPSIGH